MLVRSKKSSIGTLWERRIALLRERFVVNKQETLNQLGRKLDIPESVWKLGKGSTEKREFVRQLAVRLYAVAADDSAGITKKELMRAVLAKLEIVEDKHFSTGDTITAKAFSDTLDKVKLRYE